MNDDWEICLDLPPDRGSVPALRALAARLLGVSGVAETDGVRVQMGLDEAAHALLAVGSPRAAALHIRISLRRRRVDAHLAAPGTEMPERALLARARPADPRVDPSLPALRAHALRATCSRITLTRSSGENSIHLGYDVRARRA